MNIDIGDRNAIRIQYQNISNVHIKLYIQIEIAKSIIAKHGIMRLSNSTKWVHAQSVFAIWSIRVVTEYD